MGVFESDIQTKLIVLRQNVFNIGKIIDFHSFSVVTGKRYPRLELGQRQRVVRTFFRPERKRLVFVENAGHTLRRYSKTRRSALWTYWTRFRVLDTTPTLLTPSGYSFATACESTIRYESTRRNSRAHDNHISALFFRRSAVGTERKATVTGGRAVMAVARNV